MKKTISFLIVLATLISCFAFPVFAGETVISDEGRLPFEDVKENHWFYEAVELCYANSVIKGMNDYTFGWNGQLTRAQFVTMLAGLEGIDTNEYTISVFTDVKSNHWYYGSVAWAYENGIVNGMTDTTFSPNRPLTRAQLAVVMKNYMQYEYEVEVREDILDKYTDKPKEEYWYYDAMKYSVASGLVSGVTETTLVATGVVTRGQAAVIFKNFMDKYYYASCEHSFSEATCTRPLACSECGFVNGLPKGHAVDASYNCKTEGKCTVCFATVAKSNILHDFTKANCGKPRTCKRCSVTRGEPVGDHEWWTATCTNPKMCKICYKTEGKALGHTTPNGYCTRCKKNNFTSDYDKKIYYIKTKGRYDADNGLYYIQSGPLYILYTPATDVITFAYTNHYDGPGYTELTELEFTRDSEDPMLYFSYFVGDTCVFVGGYIVDASEFSELDAARQFDEYVGTYDFEYSIFADMGLNLMLKNADSLLGRLYGGSIDDYGFVSFPLPY